MFNITEGKGFHIRFQNGWVVSVQWGSGNYGQNYNRRVPTSEVVNPLAWKQEHDNLNRELGAKGAPTAEVAVWFDRATSNMTVCDAPMTPDELALFMLEVANRKIDWQPA